MARQSLALNRFGLGARGGDRPPDDPVRWLLRQLDAYDPAPPSLAAAPTRFDVAAALAGYMGGRPMRMAAMRAPAAMTPAMMSDLPDLQADPGQEARRLARRDARAHYVDSVAARTNAALDASSPFVERLVHFWSNHFAVSADRLTVVGLAGPFEFEAIRPHVLGRFGDMLLAVQQHPAMLLYLDQAQSIGPDSQLGTRIAARGRRNAGLNENLAREILELHTLGVRGGYSQEDVTELARALTGWTVAGVRQGAVARAAEGRPGSFHFAGQVHQPGSRTIMGRRYDQQGEAQARAILADLAVYPATAKHVATKLARHFAADDPSPALIQRLSAAFLKSGGDLPAVYRTLVESPEAWVEGAKFRTPWDWTVAALRAVGTRETRGQQMVGLLTQLGQPVWRPGSPAGYDDIAASWAAPDALVRRVEAAERLAGRVPNPVDARELARRLFPDGLSDATAQAIARAESPAQGLALLLVAPEFLRR